MVCYLAMSENGTMEMMKRCTSCGSRLEFDPESGNLVCSSCRSVAVAAEEFSAANIRELNLDEELTKAEEAGEFVEKVTAKCPSCGAENFLDDNVVADNCAYCKTPLVASAQSTRVLKPQGIVPFVVTREQANEIFAKWLSERWFLPNAAKKCENNGCFVGIYRPHWTFDYNTETDYVGRRGDYYYVSVPYTTTVNGKTVTRYRRERRTRWTPAYGHVKNSFDDIIVVGVAKMSGAIEEAIGAWTPTDAVDYNPDLIRGFREECYDVPLKDGFEKSKSIAEKSIRRTVNHDIGGDLQQIYRLDVEYSNMTCKQLLMPLWFDAYVFDGKTYNIAINGQSGAIYAERPWSAVKITFFVLVISAILGCLVYVIATA